MLQERLLQSQKAFLEQKRRNENGQQHNNGKQQQNPNRLKSNGWSKSNVSSAKSSNRSMLKEINARISALEVQPSTSAAKAQPQVRQTHFLCVSKLS